jgi:hypothetical protein
MLVIQEGKVTLWCSSDVHNLHRDNDMNTSRQGVHKGARGALV